MRSLWASLDRSEVFLGLAVVSTTLVLAGMAFFFFAVTPAGIIIRVDTMDWLSAKTRWAHQFLLASRLNGEWSGAMISGMSGIAREDPVRFGLWGRAYAE